MIKEEVKLLDCWLHLIKAKNSYNKSEVVQFLLNKKSQLILNIIIKISYKDSQKEEVLIHQFHYHWLWHKIQHLNLINQHLIELSQLLKIQLIVFSNYKNKKWKQMMLEKLHINQLSNMQFILLELVMKWLINNQKQLLHIYMHNYLNQNKNYQN